MFTEHCAIQDAIQCEEVSNKAVRSPIYRSR